MAAWFQIFTNNFEWGQSEWGGEQMRTEPILNVRTTSSHRTLAQLGHKSLIFT